MKTFKLVITIAVIFGHQLSAQKKTFVTPDTLKNKSFDYIIDRIDEFDGIKGKDSLYINVYLAKAKAEKDYVELAAAYKSMMYLNDKKYWLIYSDSIIYAAKKTHDDAEIGAAFLTKGIIWYSFRKKDKALENYLIADSHISKTDDQYLIFTVKYSIGQMKYLLGYFNEANALLLDCVNYFREEGGKPYLNSLHALGLTYTRIGKFEKCTETNNLGKVEAQKSGNSHIIPYFIQSEGINDFYKNDYSKAIIKLENAMPGLVSRKDLANVTLTSYYIGRIYWSFNQKDKAITYLKKVDDAFVKDGFIKEEFIEAYVLLINYYEVRGEDKLLREYLNRALKAEKIVFHESRNLSRKVASEYDFKKIADANKRLEEKLKIESVFKTAWLLLSIVLGVIIAVMICRRMHQNRIRKQKFNKIMLQKDASLQPVLANKKIQDGDIEIKPETVASVSTMLEKFEKSKKFLDNDFTLTKLSIFVDCNTTYTSRIILQTRGKRYNDYIDWLRINYIVDKLKNEKKYRGYTIKALTEEAGYLSPQKFRAAFKTNLDMTPLFFIKELEKLNPKQPNT